MVRSAKGSKFVVQFYIEGKKTHGLGYRAHLGMLALTSGVDRLYAENLEEVGIQRIAVYAGAERWKDITKFYENVRQKIPKEARVDTVTKPKSYHSEIEILPTVSEFVPTLTAQELAKGVRAITGLGEEAKRGFKNLGNKLDGVGKQVVDALIEVGIIPEKRTSKTNINPT